MLLDILQMLWIIFIEAKFYLKKNCVAHSGKQTI